MSASTPEARLEAMGLSLPSPPTAVANYVGLVRVDNIAFVSGHGPTQDGEHIYLGKLGQDVDVATGQKSAQLVMLNMLATLKAELGELDRIERVVKLLCMVNSAPDFAEQPVVANGASDLLVEIFGTERGKHARSAVGMGALPFRISVEIEGIFQIRA
jgi:enamine deaminase RidA (YjgF/YER057c/UK114 family)